MSPVPSSARELRVVFDTNVIRSGLFRPGGNEAAVIQLGIEGEIEVYLSPFILADLERVLSTRFQWSGPQVERSLANLQQWATQVETTLEVSAVQTDADDNHILECCLAVQADYRRPEFSFGAGLAFLDPTQTQLNNR